MEDLQPELHPEDTGARLRAVRELSGLSPRDVARAAGLTSHEIAAVERGRRRISQDELEALAGALHVSPEMLVSDGQGVADQMRTTDRPAALPDEVPGAERRRDFTTRKQVEDSWSDVRAEMESVIHQCVRVSTVGSGDDILDMLDTLEVEIRQLKINRSFQRELGRHERTIAEARGHSSIKSS